MNKMIKLTAITFFGASLMVGGLYAAAAPVANGTAPASAPKKAAAPSDKKISSCCCSCGCRLPTARETAVVAGIAGAGYVNPGAAVAFVAAALPTYVACKFLGAVAACSRKACAAVVTLCCCGCCRKEKAD